MKKILLYIVSFVLSLSVAFQLSFVNETSFDYELEGVVENRMEEESMDINVICFNDFYYATTFKNKVKPTRIDSRYESSFFVSSKHELYLLYDTI